MAKLRQARLMAILSGKKAKMYADPALKFGKGKAKAQADG